MKRKKTMTREEAQALYDNLHKAMGNWMKQKQAGASGAVKSANNPAPRSAQNQGSRKVDPAEIAAVIKQGLNSDQSSGGRGVAAAVALVLIIAVLKVGLVVFEALGIGAVADAKATVVQAPQKLPISDRQGISREEREILTALDARRVALEERSRRLDEREQDLEKRDREFVTRLTEIRELTSQLRIDRDKNQRQRDEQLNQLSKVYSSMNPTEAAPLIEQLDITIALALLERMSEKRVAQILALMNHERALMITRMLSGR